MELSCPSCEARYRVPDGAIVGRGRQVSCSNCGHGWHAVPPPVPPPVPGARSRPSGMPAAGAAADGPARMARQEHPPESAGTTDAHGPRTSEPSRLAQLAEIREMIAQVQSEERAPGTDRPETQPTADARRAPAGSPAAAPVRNELRRVDDVDEHGEPLHQDPLRRRMAEHDARAARERNEREKLRRSMKNRRHEKKGGSGAFVSGFLLVVLAAAALLATYLLHEEIIARLPESAPVLAEYVQAIDDLRVSIADGYDQARDWVMGMIADAA